MDVELPLDFKEFLSLLNDIDIWIAINPSNAERMVAVLHEFGVDASEVTVELFLNEWRIVRMGFPPMRIKVTTSISGVTFEECFAERVRETLDGVAVNIISLRHLKQNKQASGRFKDLNDLEHLP